MENRRKYLGLLLIISVIFTLLSLVLPLQAAIRAPATEGKAFSLDATPSFVANIGQFEQGIHFHTQVSGGNIFFQESSIAIVLPVVSKAGDTRNPPLARSTKNIPPSPVVAINYEGATKDASITGIGPRAGVFNYFEGNDPRKWITNAPSFDKVKYTELYSGINLEYIGLEHNLKSTYVVSPNADPRVIRWTYNGAKSVQIEDGSKDLIIELPDLKSEEYIQPNARLVESAPIAWQEDASGLRKFVPIEFVIEPDQSIRFNIGAYDVSRELIIDPTLDFGSYFSSTSDDFADGVATDSAGNTYVVGYGLDLSLPNPIVAPLGFNAHVIKLSPTGSLVFHTYLGAGQSEFVSGRKIVLDSSGNIFIAGEAGSNLPFPNGTNALQTNPGGDTDVFVAKFNTSGVLQATTYLGGAGYDVVFGMSIDASDNVYVVGESTSSTFTTNSSINQNWPSSNSHQPSNTSTSNSDAYVARINNSLTGLGYGSFLGGSGADIAYGIAVHNTSTVYVVGSTASSNFDKKTPFSGQSTLRGSLDGFIAKFNPQASSSSSSLVTSTYYGGTSFDAAYGVATDSSGNAYVTGYTESSSGFPLQASNSTTQILDNTFNGVVDAFVAKINLAWTINYSSYFGGSDYDMGRAIRVDANNSAYILGETVSTNFPKDGLLQPSIKGGVELYTVGIHPLGGNFMFGSYLGGSLEDRIQALALSTKQMPSYRPTASPSGPTPTPQSIRGVNHAVGYTLSSDFPTYNSVDSNDFGLDGFAVKYAPYPSPTTSYYMTTVDGTILYNRGCDRGTRDGTRYGVQKSLVILDFGQPAVSGTTYGSILFDSQQTFVSTSQIANAAQEFGRGYYNCIQAVDPSSTLTVAIGTNNSGANVTSTHGQKWAEMAKSVQDWFVTNGFSGQVASVGANDIEVEFNSPATTRPWVDGYNGVSNRPAMYNFGDASACPTTYTGTNQTCNHTQVYTGSKWKQEDVWYVSAGVTSARALPQIYPQSGIPAQQWYQISLYGSVIKGSRVLFVGALTQYKACKDKSPSSYTSGTCVNTDQIAEEGWRYLWTEIQKDTRTQQVFGLYLIFSTDIRWNPPIEEY